MAEDAKTAEEQRLAREKLALEVQKLVVAGLKSFKILDPQYRLLILGSDADKAKAAALLRAEEASIRGANTPAAPAAPAAAAAPTAAAAATTYPVPNASAINALKSNQGSPEQFDAIFGPGAARKILGK